MSINHSAPSGLTIAPSEMSSQKHAETHLGHSQFDVSLSSLVGHSSKIEAIRNQVQRIAQSQIKDILIQGETGTGKEIVAQAICQLRNGCKPIPVHCGALNQGLVESELFGHVQGAFTGAEKMRKGAFEEAMGGAVFLDEIAEMPLLQQAKLLRVLQERRIQRVGSHKEISVDFTSISATNSNLSQQVLERNFRQDLYYRISVETITLPPLRDHLEDIPSLIEHFLVERSLTRYSKYFNQLVYTVFKKHDWPGNVRELFNVMERLVSRFQHCQYATDSILESLPDILGSTPILDQTDLAKMSQTRKIHRPSAKKVSKIKSEIHNRHSFIAALKIAKGCATLAAKSLGISRATFFRYARVLRISCSLTQL